MNIAQGFKRKKEAKPGRAKIRIATLAGEMIFKYRRKRSCGSRKVSVLLFHAYLPLLSLFIRSLYFLPSFFLVDSLARLTVTKGTWHSATGMESALIARDLGSSGKRNIVLVRATFPSRNSACASSIFTLARARARGLTSNDPRALRHFMSHNYCPSVPILRYLRPAGGYPFVVSSSLLPLFPGERVFLRLRRAYAHNAHSILRLGENNSVS